MSRFSYRVYLGFVYRDGYLQSRAAQVGNVQFAFRAILDETKEFLEFEAQAMPLHVSLEGDGLLSVEVQGELLHHAHRSLHLDVSFLALDASEREAIAVLCGSQSCHEVRIAKQDGSARVDTVPSVLLQIGAIY